MLYSDSNQKSPEPRINLRASSCNNYYHGGDGYHNPSNTKHCVKITKPVTDKEFDNTPLNRWRRLHSADRVNTTSSSPLPTSPQAGNEMDKVQEWMCTMRTQLQILTTPSLSSSIASGHTRQSASHSVNVNLITEISAIIKMMQSALIQA